MAKELLRFALIGKDITHSKSPDVYRSLLKSDIDYHFLDYASEAEIPPLPDLLNIYPRISITAPYKNYVFKQVDETIGLAGDLQAVNAIKLSDGKVSGTITDEPAFRDIFREQYSAITKAFILGDGAMSRMSQKVLEDQNISFVVASRRLGNLGLLSSLMAKESGELLVINACSRQYRINFKSAKSLKIWDLNYGVPENKSFADENAHQYQDGLELLIRQAQYALRFWNL